MIKVSETDVLNDDAWELGSGVNYSVNQLAGFFNKRFGTETTYIEEQKGNYRETLNTNTDAIDRLGWKPEDRLSDYIKSL